MTSEEFNSEPEVPKSRMRSPTRRSYATAELHSGQYDAVTGTPPTVPLTSSCQVMIRNG